MKNDLFEQTLAATDWEKPDPAWRELVVGRAVPRKRKTSKTIYAVAACWVAILGLKVATPKEEFKMAEWPSVDERQYDLQFEERRALLAHLDFETWERTRYNERREYRF